jgi:pyrroline-5-carboxylate reductase
MQGDARDMRFPRPSADCYTPATMSDATPPLTGFIGAGNMARSLAGGLIRDGWPQARLLLADPDANQRDGAAQALGVRVLAANAEVAAQAEILVLAVKPQVLGAVCRDIAVAVQRQRPLVISVAAGVRMADLARWLGETLPIVRVMPNTPALIGSGASGLFANEHVSESQRDQAESILRAVGITVWVAQESLMDVVTAVSGSGPAYFFLMMEALEAAARQHGLDDRTARLLTLETAYGAAKMALEGEVDPRELRRRVTSPGGTTEQAVRVLQDAGIERMFNEAVAAAIRRAGELGELFGKNA